MIDRRDFVKMTSLAPLMPIFGTHTTYHRMYKGKDSGKIFAFNLTHCDDKEIVGQASEGKSPMYN